jgi:hypothetical protein
MFILQVWLKQQYTVACIWPKMGKYSELDGFVLLSQNKILSSTSIINSAKRQSFYLVESLLKYAAANLMLSTISPCRLPISAFAAIGFEHCIANMFLIPLAIAYGAPIDARLFVAYNLVPSTLGNWVGGAICVSTVYALIYGTPSRAVCTWIDMKQKTL